MFWWGFTPKIDPNLAQGSNLLKYLWSTFITPHPASGRVFRINSMPFVLKGENYQSSVRPECISWFVQWNNSILNYLSELFRYKYFSNSPMLLTSPIIIIQAFLGGGRAVIIFQFPLGVFIPTVSLWYWGWNVAQQWHWHISILADHCRFSSPRHPRHSGSRHNLSIQSRISTAHSYLLLILHLYLHTEISKSHFRIKM